MPVCTLPDVRALCSGAKNPWQAHSRNCYAPTGFRINTAVRCHNHPGAGPSNILWYASEKISDGRWSWQLGSWPPRRDCRRKLLPLHRRCRLPTPLHRPIVRPIRRARLHPQATGVTRKRTPLRRPRLHRRHHRRPRWNKRRPRHLISLIKAGSSASMPAIPRCRRCYMRCNCKLALRLRCRPAPAVTG